MSGLDACTLLDEQTLQELTGESLEFTTSQFWGGHCFWGATTPVPPYVEIEISSRLEPGYNRSVPAGCSTVPVAGVGTQAMGATCSDPQQVFLFAWDRGVALTLIVNEPSRPLEPDDLAATVASVLEEIE